MPVSTHDVVRARRSAQKLGTWAPCVSCRAQGKKCDRFRPCSRCVKTSRPCFKSEDVKSKEVAFIHSTMIPVQRPLNFQPKFVIGDESIPVVALAPGFLWASIELMKQMAVGHEVDSLGQFFASLTVYDSLAFSQAIYGSGAAALGNIGSRSHNAALPAIQSNAPDRRESEECEHSELWDMVTGTASVSTKFDPVSSRRRDIIANAHYASIYGVHPEEFQARCASRELSFPIAEEDAVAMFIFATVSLQSPGRSESSCSIQKRGLLRALPASLCGW